MESYISGTHIKFNLSHFSKTLELDTPGSEVPRYDTDDENKKKAVELFQQSTDRGCTDAAYNLSLCYLNGDGIAQDKEKAFDTTND